ncbi:MAG: 4Fe-4S binding protein [Oscillospiraceae bacterium]|nr:4Fe-4S binding protein [Oscillospiraceae bacterium]
MKKLLILSGKGGTGKTTTAAAFSRFSQAKAVADCDVDAPNLHLVAKMSSQPTKSDFYGSKKAKIDTEKCIGCAACVDNCRFNALIKTDSGYTVSEYACEGCGVCTLVCPTGAAVMTDDVAGELVLYKEDVTFSTAMLKMGRGNSGLLVTAVKNALTSAAPDAELAIIDGSPGIGCPVIASMNGVDMVLIVAEPSLSGLSDMKRILKTAEKFGTKTAVCVNKYDVSPQITDEIKKYCSELSVPFAGVIPYDKQVSEAINNGMSIADVECPAREAMIDVYKKTIAML